MHLRGPETGPGPASCGSFRRGVFRLIVTPYAPAHNSASPSYCSRPEFAPRPASFLKAIRSWLRGDRPSLQQQMRDARLAAEMEAERADSVVEDSRCERKPS
jgi:hypothetical protein